MIEERIELDICDELNDPTYVDEDNSELDAVVEDEDESLDVDEDS